MSTYSKIFRKFHVAWFTIAARFSEFQRSYVGNCRKWLVGRSRGWSAWIPKVILVERERNLRHSANEAIYRTEYLYVSTWKTVAAPKQIMPYAIFPPIQKYKYKYIKHIKEDLKGLYSSESWS